MLSLHRGDSKVYRYTVRDTSGTVVDISLYDVTFSVKKRYTDTSYTFQKTTTPVSGIVKTDAVNGVFEVTLSPSDTNSKATGDYVYDVQLNDTTHKYTIDDGTFRIVPDVTR